MRLISPLKEEINFFHVPGFLPKDRGEFHTQSTEDTETSARSSFYPCLQVFTHRSWKTNFKLKYETGDQYTFSCASTYLPILGKDFAGKIWLAGDGLFLFQFMVKLRNLDTSEKEGPCWSLYVIYPLWFHTLYRGSGYYCHTELLYHLVPTDIQ